MDTALLFSKLLPLLVMPVGATCLFLLLGLFLMLLGARKLAFFTTTLALAVLITGALPITAERLGSPLERMYPAQQIATAPPADAIIILGGGVDIPIAPRRSPEFNTSGDRLLEGARLYRAGRAPVVLLSGGNVFEQNDMQGESIYAAELVAMLGVDPAAIVVEADSRTTFENAVQSRRYLRKKGIRRVLLVTSASHMPRAMATFDSAGIDAIAAPVDYRFTDSKKPKVMKFIPNASALSNTTTILHEYIGFFVYRWRGWISDGYGFRPAPSKSFLASRQSVSS